MVWPVCVVLVLVGLAAPAAAAPGPGVTGTAGPATVDWSRGLIVVTTVGIADRRAPSPASARAAARRRAEEQAGQALAAALAELPWAGARPAAPPAAWISQHRVVLAEELVPDGSWRLQIGLPIEALRQRRDGVRVVAPGAPADAVAAVVVDARTAKVTPRAGLALEVGGKRVVGPMVWVRTAPTETELPGPRANLRAPRAPAARSDVLVADGALASADLGGALIVVVVGR